MSLRYFKTECFRFNYGFQKEKPDMSEKALPNWVKVSKKRFDAIKNAVQNSKRDNLQARPHHVSPINFDNSSKLIQDIVHGNITYEEALNKWLTSMTILQKLLNKKVLTQTKFYGE